VDEHVEEEEEEAVEVRENNGGLSDDDDVEAGSSGKAEAEIGAGWGDLALPGDSEAAPADDAGGWGDDLDISLGLADEGASKADDAADANDVFVMPTRGKGANQLWSANSTLPADLIAAGSFDMAMHVLNRSVGGVRVSIDRSVGGK
jgi:hypothetical protein